MAKILSISQVICSNSRPRPPTHLHRCPALPSPPPSSPHHQQHNISVSVGTHPEPPAEISQKKLIHSTLDRILKVEESNFRTTSFQLPQSRVCRAAIRFSRRMKNFHFSDEYRQKIPTVISPFKFLPLCGLHNLEHTTLYWVCIRMKALFQKKVVLSSK